MGTEQRQEKESDRRKEYPTIRARVRDASACIRRHLAFALAPVRETLRVQGGTRLSPWLP